MKFFAKLRSIKPLDFKKIVWIFSDAKCFCIYDFSPWANKKIKYETSGKVITLILFVYFCCAVCSLFSEPQ